MSESPNTYFAPARRASTAVLAAQRAAFLADSTARLLLEAIPSLAVVLNTDRQVVACNTVLLETLGLESVDDLLGRRPGEVLGCVNVATAPSGCGTGEPCRECGAVLAILDCLQRGETAIRECRLTSRGEAGVQAHDLRVQASRLAVDGVELLCVSLTDISAEKRRDVLEQIFFHDVLNTAGGIHGLAELLVGGIAPDQDREFREIVLRLSETMIEEIQSHRAVMAAERGDIRVEPQLIAPSRLVEDALDLYQRHKVSLDKHLVAGDAPDEPIFTDPILVRRMLGNLIKNALEATRPGETVTVRAEFDGDEVVFAVHNPEVMPRDVQLQVFQRSFSTKAEKGRGLGTYSVRLFAEKYLGGRVDFTSAPGAGTTFTVRLPRDWRRPG